MKPLDHHRRIVTPLFAIAWLAAGAAPAPLVPFPERSFDIW
jgi:hypothetical protein